MTKTAVREQRRHPRFPLCLTLDIHAKGMPVGKCRGTIADLSVGGMTFKTDAELEEGMTLYLKLNLPLEIRGEVRHARGPVGGLRRYGVRFHKIGYIPENEKTGDFVSARFRAR